jgi:hypothetical protein
MARNKSVCAPLTVVADTSTPERSRGLAKPDLDKVPPKLKKTLSPSVMLAPLLMRSLSGTANALSGRTRMLRRMGTRPYRGYLMSISTLVLLALRSPDAGSAGPSPTTPRTALRGDGRHLIVGASSAPQFWKGRDDGHLLPDAIRDEPTFVIIPDSVNG